MVGEPSFSMIPLRQLGDGQTVHSCIAAGTTKEGYLDIPFPSSSFWERHNWIRKEEQVHLIHAGERRDAMFDSCKLPFGISCHKMPRKLFYSCRSNIVYLAA